MGILAAILKWFSWEWEDAGRWQAQSDFNRIRRDKKNDQDYRRGYDDEWARLEREGKEEDMRPGD